MNRKLVNAGDLRHRIAIQERVEEQDSETGDISFVWVTVNDVRGNWSSLPAAKMQVSAKEFEAAAAMQVRKLTRFLIRYLAGIDSKMRVLCNGEAYDIHGVIEDADIGRAYITLSCFVGINAG